MGKLYVIGVASGNYEDITIKANNVLNSSDFIYCDEKMAYEFKKYFKKKLISNSYNATLERCLNAIRSVNEGKVVSILGSGDTGIYGISSIIFEQVEKFNDNIDVEIIPGITSAISGSALLGSPLTQDFAVISLSDNLADKDMKDRIIAVAKTNFGIVFYSPCNPTHENIINAKEILLTYRSKETVVGIVSNIGNENQKVVTTTLNDLSIEDVNSFTTVFVGREETYLNKVKKMVTPLYK